MIVVNKNTSIDVLFIAEGTYPYIRGGVSAWIHDIITAMKDFKFGIIFLGSTEEDYEGIKYEIPENVVYMESYFIFSNTEYPPVKYCSGTDKVKILKYFFGDLNKLPDELSEIDFYVNEVSFDEMVFGEKTFEMIEELYIEAEIDTAFVDFFWTIRNIFIPLWVVVKAINRVIKKDIALIHSPSTGYAGFLGALLKKVKKIPYIVTEHGIYTRERKIDLLSAQWSDTAHVGFFKGLSDNKLKDMWINFFVNLGKICYQNADKVICLYKDAREIQISLGCPPEKIEVIPNGVRIEQYCPLRTVWDESRPPCVALIGRVAPIKDVKTFIKAMKLLIEKLPEAEGWVVGPTEEDPDYAEECMLMVQALSLEEKVKFLGFQKVGKILPHISISTLTSISEGMPLVILESFAAGVPCVTTDVGSCRQLIYGGLDDEDIKIGKAGEVVPVGNTQALSDAYYKILTDKVLWRQYHNTAIERVEKYYSFEKFINNYKNIYLSFIK